MLLLVLYASELGLGLGGLSESVVLGLVGGQVGLFAALLWSPPSAACLASLLLATPADSTGTEQLEDGLSSRRGARRPTLALDRWAGPSPLCAAEKPAQARHSATASTTMPGTPRKTPTTDQLSLSRPGSSLVSPPITRRRRPRAPTVLAALLILAGVLLLADAGVTLVWQEPISALYAQLKQESLGGDLRALDRAKPTLQTRQTLARLHEERRRVTYLARALERQAKAGSAVGRIRIPAIGVSFVVVKGTGTSELENGPGIYPQTSFPGIPGTTAIAGHRTTYLAPFRHIDQLHRGESIVVEMPYARLTYRVIDSRVVLPTDVSVLDPAGYSRLILSACTPLFSASHRLIVFARLTSTRAARGRTHAACGRVRRSGFWGRTAPATTSGARKPVSVCLRPSCRRITPGSPSTTRPTQVIVVSALSAASVTRSSRLRGTHTHSS